MVMWSQSRFHCTILGAHGRLAGDCVDYVVSKQVLVWVEMTLWVPALGNKCWVVLVLHVCPLFLCQLSWFRRSQTCNKAKQGSIAHLSTVFMSTIVVWEISGLQQSQTGQYCIFVHCFCVSCDGLEDTKLGTKPSMLCEWFAKHSLKWWCNPPTLQKINKWPISFYWNIRNTARILIVLQY